MRTRINAFGDTGAYGGFRTKLERADKGRHGRIQNALNAAMLTLAQGDEDMDDADVLMGLACFVAGLVARKKNLTEVDREGVISAFSRMIRQNLAASPTEPT